MLQAYNRLFARISPRFSHLMLTKGADHEKATHKRCGPHRAGGPALAADMVVRPITKAPVAPVAAAYNWSGLYSVTTAGGAWWNVDGDYVVSDHHNTSGNKFLL